MSGSSPRGRGTRRARIPFRKCPRFIPAWAGNTAKSPNRAENWTVHPRVGGEHVSEALHQAALPGSSPRGRGTHCHALSFAGQGRFIPAWAGNTENAFSLSRYMSVHPRVGGEHVVAWRMLDAQYGSSPRGRGTLVEKRRHENPARFIPAWAGNTVPSCLAVVKATVHPRVGGEHSQIEDIVRCVCGSSPRGRGTHFRFTESNVLTRFIPAWAGNTGQPGRRRRGYPVHPRVGGEHAEVMLKNIWVTGSSPRGRGTSIMAKVYSDINRFIPAWAGAIPYLIVKERKRRPAKTGPIHKINIRPASRASGRSQNPWRSQCR